MTSVRQAFLKRDIHQGTISQREGEGGVICRGFCGVQGKQSEENGFSEPMPTILEDLNQTVPYQHRVALLEETPKGLLGPRKLQPCKLCVNSGRMEHTKIAMRG